MLVQCAALAHLNLSANRIGSAGAESFSRVFGQWQALADLNFSYNQIRPAGAEFLGGHQNDSRLQSFANPFLNSGFPSPAFVAR